MLDLSYKMYVRHFLDYGDIIYHNQRDDLMDLIERVQYKAALIVSGCWHGTSRVKLYDELGWESLSDRRMLHRLTTFYKIINGLAPSYLTDHIPNHDDINVTLRNRDDKTPLIRTLRYENSFFPYTIKAWKNLKLQTASLEYTINLGLSYSLKLELVFQIYVIVGLIIISTVVAPSARVALKTRHLLVWH